MITFKIIKFFGVLLIAVLFNQNVYAAQNKQGLIDRGPALITAIDNLQTLKISSPILGTTSVFIAAIRPPEANDKNTAAFTFAARQFLEKSLINKTVDIYTGPVSKDRYGRLIAQIFLKNQDWVQALILQNGLARVETNAGSVNMVSRLYEFEKFARAKGRGIWSDPAYQLISAQEKSMAVNLFQIIQGQVQGAAKINGTVYLNFTENWRDDFTIEINRPALKIFKQQKIDVLKWAGKTLRVRGWVVNKNGPMINVSHPLQIEMIK